MPLLRTLEVDGWMKYSESREKGRSFLCGGNRRSTGSLSGPSGMNPNFQAEKFGKGWKQQKQSKANMFGEGGTGRGTGP